MFFCRILESNGLKGHIIRNLPLNLTKLDCKFVYFFEFFFVLRVFFSILSIVSENKLTGVLPPLPRPLTVLDVSRNQLHGFLPDFPKELQRIDVRDNSFHGLFPVIPISLTECSKFLLNNNNYN